MKFLFVVYNDGSRCVVYIHMNDTIFRWWMLLISVAASKQNTRIIMSMPKNGPRKRTREVEPITANGEMPYRRFIMQLLLGQMYWM